MEIDVLKRKIGLNFTANGVSIWLWAPEAESVWLISGGHRLRLEHKERGYWFLETDKLRQGDQYQIEFSTENERKILRADPASLLQHEGVHGASTAVNLEYPFTDSHWHCPAMKDFIIYELHVGTFSDEGTFDGVLKHLSHLAGLGVTAIELMPVAQFAGGRNWGYDGVFPFAVQNSYGGPKALQRLTDACHDLGIAVILDVVYNHFGPEGNYFADFGPWFTDKYHTPWGKAINFDDERSDGVRDFFIENCLMWFRDFHVDALRLDAVHAIKDFSAEHILTALRRYTDKLSAETGRTHYLIAECDLNDPRYISETSVNGIGMHGQWADEFHHALRVSAGQDQNGYYADFNGVADLAKAYRNAWVYDGQYSSHRKRFFGKPATGHPGEQFIVFSQNHDQIGNRMLGERSSSLYSFEMLKLLAGAVFCSPFLPLIFMGEEWGEQNPFQFFTSHSDTRLIAAVREGRQKEFSAFYQQGEAPDPQAEETFLRSKLNWTLQQSGAHSQLAEYYKRLIHVRKTHPLLSSADRDILTTEIKNDNQVLQLNLAREDRRLIVLMNFSQMVQSLTLPIWCYGAETLLYSAGAQWGGSVDPSHPLLIDHQLPLLPESIIILSTREF